MAKPYVLSIAGFDPSGGAGVLADIKTIEANGGYGLGVLSANTFQDDTSFVRVEWIALEKIKEQLAIILKRFRVDHFKIGLIENRHTLQQLLSFIREYNPTARIVWDPILKASAGFLFHSSTDWQELHMLLKRIDCITPNIPEALALFGTKDELLKQLHATSVYCSVYLKDGHGDETVVTDRLFNRHEMHAYPNQRIYKGEKHGSGCVLSAALTTQLALGYDMPVACQYANAYTQQFLASNETLLGYHQYQFSYEANQ